ncbi:MaoC family dehydratase [Oxalobacteraceae bacterium A2-2]
MAPTNVPLRLIRHQGAMLPATLRLLWRSVLPRRSAPVPQAGRLAIERTIAAPADELVAHYLAWCGAEGRYPDSLPPHMVAQWGVPLVSALLLQLPFRPISVVNQGVLLRVHGALPRAVPLQVRAVLQSVEKVPGRVKIDVLIITGTAQQPLLVETTLRMSFMLPGPRAPKPAASLRQEAVWRTVGSWRAHDGDGLRFALLTGDFNPIHWCGPLARRSVFKGLVLHGFGSLARSYELLPPGLRHEIDVRFLRPVPLDGAELHVELDDADILGGHALRLAGGAGAVHLAGRCR